MEKIKFGTIFDGGTGVIKKNKMNKFKLTKSERDKRRLLFTTTFQAEEFIGKQCAKFSGKPFKSGNKINTITGVNIMILNNGKQVVAFYFDEDKTYVDCKMVYIID